MWNYPKKHIYASLEYPLPAIILSDTYLGSLRAESQLPLTRYAIDVERYRFGSSPDYMDPAFYPIPQIKVTRDTYL